MPCAYECFFTVNPNKLIKTYVFTPYPILIKLQIVTFMIMNKAMHKKQLDNLLFSVSKHNFFSMLPYKFALKLSLQLFTYSISSFGLFFLFIIRIYMEWMALLLGYGYNYRSPYAAPLYCIVLHRLIFPIVIH